MSADIESRYVSRYLHFADTDTIEIETGRRGLRAAKQSVCWWNSCDRPLLLKEGGGQPGQSGDTGDWWHTSGDHSDSVITIIITVSGVRTVTGRGHTRDHWTTSNTADSLRGSSEIPFMIPCDRHYGEAAKQDRPWGAAGSKAGIFRCRKTKRLWHFVFESVSLLYPLKIPA